MWILSVLQKKWLRYKYIQKNHWTIFVFISVEFYTQPQLHQRKIVYGYRLANIVVQDENDMLQTRSESWTLQSLCNSFISSTVKHSDSHMIGISQRPVCHLRKRGWMRNNFNTRRTSVQNRMTSEHLCEIYHTHTQKRCFILWWPNHWLGLLKSTWVIDFFKKYYMTIQLQVKKIK